MAWVVALPKLRTSTERNLPPRHPLRTPLGQVLPLRDQTLVNRTGQQGDAVPADLVAEVLTGDTDRPSAGWFENIPLKELQLLRGGSRWRRSGRGHRTEADTSVLLTKEGWGQGVH